MVEILPTDLNLAIGNSVPITNNSIIIPNSANTFTVSILCIRLNGGDKVQLPFLRQYNQLPLVVLTCR